MLSMKRIFSNILLALLFFFCGGFIFSQNYRVILEFYENMSGDLRIVSQDGRQEKYGDELSFGDLIPLGWTLVTGSDDTAELTVEPSGTIIKVSENTNFKIESIQGLDTALESSFALGFGKFRTIAGKLTGQERYTFHGQSATCGVRGTDFGMQRLVVEGVEVEEAFVFEGQVSYTINATEETIMLTEGQYADALAPIFKAEQMPEFKKKNLLGELNFKKLSKESVPGVESKEAGEEPAAETTTEGEAEELFPAGSELSDFLAFEIGALSIGDDTYAKAVITPTLKLGQFRMALYLPVIYSNNLLDPLDWYRPKGNQEWSFGTDQGSDAEAIIQDIAIDLALKIKYIEWADRRDPFFFKLGNLSHLTIGHGLIMRNYANDSDFPAIRRLGINFGFDFTVLGFEAIINDLTEPEIFGGRIYMRPAAPAFPLAIGLTGIIDIQPAGDLPLGASEAIGNPILINTGLDLDFPFIETDTFSLILFGDIAGLLPYYRNSGLGPYSGVTQGLAWETLIDVDPTLSLRNFGAALGLIGNIGPVDWRLEYRFATGTFVPSIVDNIYDRQRSRYAIDLAEYTNDPTDPEYDRTTMGIYGEVGYTMQNVFSVEAGYLLPFTASVSRLEWDDRDYLHLEARLEQSAIPVLNIGLSIAYDRFYFAPMLFYGKNRAGHTLSFFDENTVVSTRLIFGASDNVDLIFLLTTTVLRDENGSVAYNDDLNPRLATTLSIETQIHF